MAQFLNQYTSHGAFSLSFLIIVLSLVSSVYSKCKEGGKPEIGLRIWDEFGDNATIFREGGTVEIACDGGGFWPMFLQVGMENRSDWEDIELKNSFGNSSSVNISIKSNQGLKGKIFTERNGVQCRCGIKGELSKWKNLGKFHCNQSAEISCEKTEVCMLDGETGEQSCKNLPDNGETERELYFEEDKEQAFDWTIPVGGLCGFLIGLVFWAITAWILYGCLKRHDLLGEKKPVKNTKSPENELA